MLMFFSIPSQLNLFFCTFARMTHSSLFSHGLLVPSGPAFPTIKSKANLSPVPWVTSFKFNSVFSHFRNVKRQPYIKNMTVLSTYRVLWKHIRPQEWSIFYELCSSEEAWQKERRKQEKKEQAEVSGGSCSQALCFNPSLVHLQGYQHWETSSRTQDEEKPSLASLDFIKLQSHRVSIGYSMSAMGIPN